MQTCAILLFIAKSIDQLPYVTDLIHPKMPIDRIFTLIIHYTFVQHFAILWAYFKSRNNDVLLEITIPALYNLNGLKVCATVR